LPGGRSSLGGRLAGFVFRPVALLFLLRLVLPEQDIFVAGNRRAAFLRDAIGGADLDQLGFGCDGFRDVRLHLGVEAFGIGALCGIWANCKSFLLALRRHADHLSRFECSSECYWCERL
jgi:hypothetical protein